MERFVIASLIIFALVTLLGSGRGHVKVEVTATVSSDGKLYSGSSVQEYRCHKPLPIMSATSTCDINGEAVVVDVPGRGHLFLVFGRPHSRSQTAMVWSLLKPVTSDPMGASNEDLPERWFLAVDQMPMMVRFTDPANPFSVREVDPGYLPSEMGAGVRLVSVEVQKSKEKVTFGKVEKAIPWIGNPGFDFYRNRLENPLSETLTRSRFISKD